jgi:hypothetical protein
MENLKLRQVGTRHIASAFRNGRNEDVGEIDEAHLRAYAARLPGSYTVPNSAPKDTGRGEGFACREFSAAVLNRAQQIRSSDSELSELEAHRLAMAQVAKENPNLPARYRTDAKEI